MLSCLQALWHREPVRITALCAAVVVFAAAKVGVVIDPQSALAAAGLVLPIILGGELSRGHVLPVRKLVTDPKTLPADMVDKAAKS